MHKLIMEEARSFPNKVDEINRVLKDGWDIYEGPFCVGEYICIKLIRSSPVDESVSNGLPDIPSGLIKFEEEDKDW